MTRLVALGEVAEVNPPLAASIGRTRPDEIVPFVSMAAVSEDGRARYDEQRPISSVRQGYTSFSRGDVLLAKITPCFQNGKAAHLSDLPTEIGFGSTEFHVIRAGTELDARYLFYAMWNDSFRKTASHFMTGTAGQKRLPTDYLRRRRIRLPSLEEQRRIASILDKANHVRRQRHETTSLLGQFESSLFSNLFGDPRTNAHGWYVVPLDQVSQIASGITKGRKLPSNGVTQVPYLRVANVQDGYLDLTEVKTIGATHVEINRYALKDGDILLTEGGDPDKRGRGAVWHGEVEECVHQNHIFRVRLGDDALIPEYVSALLGSAYGKRFFLKAAKQTTGIASINRTQLARFPVMKAPIELQHRYAAVLRCVRGLTGRVLAAGQSTDELYYALAARTLSG